MAPGKKPATAEASSSKSAPAAELGPALLPATITNENGLAKARPLLASTPFEGGATKIWLGSHPRRDLRHTVVPVFPL
jgi:hypothetical protein